MGNVGLSEGSGERSKGTKAMTGGTEVITEGSTTGFVPSPADTEEAGTAKQRAKPLAEKSGAG